MHQLRKQRKEKGYFLRIGNFSNYCNPLEVEVYNAEDAFLALLIGQ